MKLSHSFLFAFFFVFSITRNCESLVALKQSITEVLDEELLPTDSIENMCAYPNPPLLDAILEDEREKREMDGFRSNFLLKGRRSHEANLFYLEGNISFITSGASHWKSAAWNKSHFIESLGIWIDPEEEIKNKTCTMMHEGGSYVIHQNFFPDNFGHIVHDHFPTWFWTLFLLSERPEVFDSKLIGSKILVPQNKVATSFLKFWSELFGKDDPIKWFRDNFHFYTTGQIQCFQTAQVGVIVHNVDMGHKYPWNSRSPFLILAARSYFDSLLRKSLGFRNKIEECPEGKFIIFYSRKGNNVYHGRQVDNEDEVISLIEKEMNEKRRTERLVVFNGEGMSMEEQYNLFRCATTVIGPHGSGMANVMWTAMSPRCEHPVHVIETVCGKRSERIQGGCPFMKTYYFLSGTVPWVHYHNIYFQIASEQTLIPADTLLALLQKIWLIGEASLKFYDYTLHL